MKQGILSSLAGGAVSAFLLVTGSTYAPPAKADGAPNGTPEPAPPPNADPNKLLLGDIGGLRSQLTKLGITPALTETEEILGNVTGGVHQGLIYEGLTDFSLAYDFRPVFHWRGNFFVRGYQIHGRGLSAENINNLNTVSSLEATAATRLFELWYEQHIDDWLRIRIGQQSAAQEFMIAVGGKPFVNSAFGWPTLPGLDLPSGGPNYPLATPGIRVRIDVNEELTLFTGIFNGDPAGSGAGNPQQRDPSGTSFRTNDGVFAIAEVRYNPSNSPKSTTYRLGGWYNSKSFADLEVDTSGGPLASPLSTGLPRQHTGDSSIYAVVDQPLFGDGPDGLAVFARAMAAPSDRNLIDSYFDGGITYKNPSKNLFDQAGDTMGFAVAYAHIGEAARALAAETAAFTGQTIPRRSSETVLEVTYQTQLMPGWQVQPDLQYVINPGGGIPNPRAPATSIKNALVGGVRTTIAF